jgi:hypothetical protein
MVLSQTRSTKLTQDAEHPRYYRLVAGHRGYTLNLTRYHEEVKFIYQPRTITRGVQGPVIQESLEQMQKTIADVKRQTA